MSDILIDTNVLVYAYDARERDKQERAVEVLRHLVVDGQGKLSAQVLGEFVRATTTKLDPALTAREAADQVVALAASWPVLPVTALIVLEAARGVVTHRLNYWDAQLWATARLNQMSTILTEDFTHGREIDHVRFVNPFVSDFDPATLS
jgi:predicted nucleic acid-binding protein